MRSSLKVWSLCAEKCWNRSTLVLNCDSPQDLPHFSHTETVSDASFAQTVPPLGPPTSNDAKLMERKTNKHGRNDAKVYGCAGVINGDESAVGVDVDVKVLHCVPAPFFPTHTSKCTCMRKQKHYVIMTSLEKGGGSECAWGLTLLWWHVETFILYPNEHLSDKHIHTYFCH